MKSWHDHKLEASVFLADVEAKQSTQSTVEIRNGGFVVPTFDIFFVVASELSKSKDILLVCESQANTDVLVCLWMSDQEVSIFLEEL